MSGHARFCDGRLQGHHGIANTKLLYREMPNGGLANLVLGVLTACDRLRP